MKRPARTPWFDAGRVRGRRPHCAGAGADRGRALGATALLILCLTASASGQPEGVSSESRRECAVCHLSWVESFEPGRARGLLLVDRPPESVVSASETCLGCHDGSIADSRRRVWLDRGHRTGIAPPPPMQVPDMLPLTEGKLACRTCHTAHSGRGPENLANTIFVRVANEASQLCQLCHPGMAKGPGLGTHPVGGMPFPMPEAIIAAGGRTGPGQSRLICQTCHTAHGAPQERLLVMGTESSQICLACHAKLRPGLWRPGAPREHPQNPPLSTPAQREAIREMGTQVGAGDRLICLSCHKLHHGLAGRYMLADTLTDSDLCVRCHPTRTSMFVTAHDLRRSAPAERNRLGQRPSESGPCGACHSFHQFARRPEPTGPDPTGLCATCHRAGQCAEKQTGLPLSHPSDVVPADLPAGAAVELYPQRNEPSKLGLACLTCHDPHETRHPRFLRLPASALCAQCHTRSVPTPIGEHDFTKSAGLKNARGRTAAETGACGFCHAVHNAVGPLMWVATSEAPKTADALCTECHRPGGLAAKEPARPLLHPAGPATTAPARAGKVAFPLFGEKGEKRKDGFVACATCHDPHAGSAGPPEMLRRGSAPETNSMCMECHPETVYINVSLHRAPLMEPYVGAKRVCGPCHAVHAKPDVQATGMWAGPLGPPTEVASLRQCTGCHSTAGGAPAIAWTEHPAVLLQNLVPSNDPSFMPLVNEAGEVSAEGRIVCITCHLPHGRSPESVLPGVNLAEIDLPNLRAVMPMLRPYIAPNLCGQCHGFDGLRRYLYYHYPEKRGGVPMAPGMRAPPARPPGEPPGPPGEDAGSSAGPRNTR